MNFVFQQIFCHSTISCNFFSYINDVCVVWSTFNNHSFRFRFNFVSIKNSVV
ncbi:unnamed protein product [Meloidogyne enterolobii]|uniref:Uncharacterized protein n=1 Tax=Meloidogyne enterolobii TaxID=390850 RepID=A0ACB0XKF1_MELEN